MHLFQIYYPPFVLLPFVLPRIGDDNDTDVGVGGILFGCGACGDCEYDDINLH